MDEKTENGSERPAAGQRPGHARIKAGALIPQLHAFQPGDHLCSSYGTIAEQLAVVIPFLKGGLGRGDGCLYVTDDRTVEDITGALEAAGVDTLRERERGALDFVRKWEWRNSGDFNVTETAARAQDLAERALAAGFSALWIAVDMTWTLTPEIGAERLAECESLWNSLLRALPVVLLCQYNRRRLAPETLHHELRTHPLVIVEDQVYPNFFYEPPEIFLHNDAQARRVDWMLEQLRLAGQAQQALRQSEERFRLLVSRVKDYAIFMIDPGGRIVSWNEGAERLKGYRPDEIIGEPLSRFYTPEDFERGHPAELLKIAESAGRVEEEGWRVRKDGTRFWADVVITALRDDQGTLRGFAKVTRDLTERKRAEESVRQLSSRLLRLQDEEQKRIARELQASTSTILDELQAQLSIVKDCGIVFDWRTAEALQKSLKLASKAAKEVRNVSNLLYPRLLDEAGLVEAVRCYAGNFTQRTGIRIVLDIPPKFARLSRDAEKALFRVVQESLTNVDRHSGSRVAEIRLTENPYAVKLEIKDQGKGVASDLLNGADGTLALAGVGIKGMFERMKQLGGRFKIESGVRGATVTANLPASIARAAGPIDAGNYTERLGAVDAPPPEGDSGARRLQAF